MCAHCPQDCPFTFIDVEDRSWMCFSCLMNNRIQTDLPFKVIHVSLIHINKCNTTDKSLFCLNFRIMINLRLWFFEVFNSNLNILNTLGQFSLKIAMHYRKTLFLFIPKYCLI